MLIGILAGFIPEWWPASNRNAWPDNLGICKQIKPNQRLSDLTCLAFSLLPLKRIDQLNGREEADLAAMMLYRLDTEAVATCVFPVPGPPTSTIFCALSINSHRCNWRTVASLISLAAKS